MFRAVLLLSFVLSGCAAGNVKELKREAYKKYEFQENLNYQQVYKNIATATRSCWESGFLFSPSAQNIVDADLYSELGKGEITIRMANLGSRVYAHTEIVKRDHTNSQVTVWIYFRTWTSMARKIRGWASGKDDC